MQQQNFQEKYVEVMDFFLRHDNDTNEKKCPGI